MIFIIITLQDALIIFLNNVQFFIGEFSAILC